jgi:hypothetical protein
MAEDGLSSATRINTMIDFFETPEECDAFLASLRVNQLLCVEGDVLQLYECAGIKQFDNYNVVFHRQHFLCSISPKSKKRKRHHHL